MADGQGQMVEQGMANSPSMNGPDPQALVQALASLGDPNVIMQIAKAAIQMLQQGAQQQGPPQQGG